MLVVNDREFPEYMHPAVVLEERCDGCAFCVEICPRSCLKIVPNPLRPSHRMVRVLAKLCSGCGACQSTCPKEAIFIPGLSTADLRAYIKKALIMAEQASVK
jgi:NAD-dependent dihydropyrimidine dehydrogenase PreA subunit